MWFLFGVRYMYKIRLDKLYDMDGKCCRYEIIKRNIGNVI